jgi:hypothetical protein
LGRWRGISAEMNTEEIKNKIENKKKIEKRRTTNAVAV